MQETAILDPLEPLVETLFQRLRDKFSAQPLPRRFLSKEALAEHLGVAPRTIKTWRSRGLPACKPGRELMFDVEEVERWIEAHS